MQPVKSHKFDRTEGLPIQLLTTKYSHLSRRLNANCVLVVARGDEGVPYSYLDKCKELLKPPTLRPLALVISYFFLLSLGGMNSIRPFMIHVFQELGMKDAASWIAVSER
jgi:hypothetical protein